MAGPWKKKCAASLLRPLWEKPHRSGWAVISTSALAHFGANSNCRHGKRHVKHRLSERMYLLDTNVLSELMRPAPAPQVLAWIDAQTPHDLYVSAVTRAEIELGIALLAAGKRRNGLAEQATAMFEDDFRARCLPFDEACAVLYAALVAARTRKGVPVSVEDAQIAATALCHSKVLVTRNVADFSGIAGLRVVNPWDT